MTIANLSALGRNEVNENLTQPRRVICPWDCENSEGKIHSSESPSTRPILANQIDSLGGRVCLKRPRHQSRVENTRILIRLPIRLPTHISPFEKVMPRSHKAIRHPPSAICNTPYAATYTFRITSCGECTAKKTTELPRRHEVPTRASAPLALCQTPPPHLIMRSMAAPGRSTAGRTSR